MRKTFLFIFALCATMMAWGEMTTGPVTYASIAKQNGWEANSYNQTLDWGGAISVTAKWEGTTKNGKSISNTSWRIYQKNLKGEFAINAAPGFIIKTIKLTYATNNNGVCSKTANASPSTTATAAADQIQSGTVYDVNASSITLYVGVTKATTTSEDITISLQTIEVTYDYDFADSYLTENFQTPDGTNWNFGTSTSGTTTDGKYYTWEHGNIRYNNQAMDVLQNGAKAVEMRNAPDAYFQTVAEGGVKYISFCWNQAGADESSYPAEKLILSVGNESETQTIVGQASASRCGDRLFSFFPVTSGKTNATIKLSNLDANRIIFGPITIVPYLRYTYTETQEVNISAGTFDCSAQINNTDGEGSIAYSSSNTDVVSFASESSPIATLNDGGEATITATWSEGASTSFKLKVIPKSTPEISFENEAITITDLYTTDPVANELTVTEGAGEVTYETSNPLVAKIVENQVMVVGVGTATITATAAENEDYLSASATYALTVNEPTGETAVSENFDGKLPYATSYQSTAVNFTDQDGLYTWTVNGHRYDGTWLRFATNADACMTSQGIQEGGVKRLSFTWKRASGGCAKIHTTIKALDKDGNEIVDRSIELVGSEDQTSNQTYNMRFDEVKQNAQFYLRNESDGFVTLISDIKIIPYLLYTKKLDDVTILAGETQATYKNEAFINNTGATPTFSIISSEPASIATIAADGIVTATAAGTIKVQAAWEDVTTTYTLNIVKNTLPVPTVSFADGDAVEKDMNVIGYVNTLTKDGDGEVTYTSSDETVAEVNTEGVITIIGEGVTTITAMIDACQTYAAAEASYELTITDPKEDAVMEKFTAYTGDEWTWSSAGTDYTLNGDLATWNTHYARRQSTDKLTSGDNATWMSVVSDVAGYLTTSTLEGGVKRIAFAWNQQKDNNGTSVGVDIYVGNEKVAGVSRAHVAAIGEDYQFNQNIFSKSSNLTIKNASVGGNGRILVGDMTITPYLLYTIKAQTHDLAEGNELSVVVPQIDNRDNENAISYSYNNIEGEEADVVSISGTTITALKAGKTEIVATWDGISTSYVLTFKEATPVFSFDPAEQTLQLGDMTGTALKPTITEGLTYSYDATSGDKEVATVDAEGNLTIHGIGETTIKAILPAQGSYAAAEAQYALTVEEGDLSDKTVDEKFSKYDTEGWTNSEGSEVTKNGDVYDWRVQLTRHKTTDKLVDDQQAIWFAQDGYVATADAEDNTKIGPAEGGIKRIAFDWNQNGADQTGDDLYISISVDGEEVSAIRRDGGEQPEQPWQYIHNLNVKKNATLKIENKSTTSEKEGGRVKIGTIVITPYLLYTKKELSAKLSDENAINVGICNNTIGGAITYTSLNPEVASLANDDPSHPDKLTLNGVGDAVIVATWTPDGSEEVVTTSYTLHVTKKADRELSFQDAVKETTVGGSGVTNILNGTFDGTAQTWSTASEGTITSVNGDGLVSPVAIGTDTVTVVVAASDTYQEGTASYQVIVRSGVADDKKLVESFSGLTKGTSDTKWEGDLKNYFSWNATSARHNGTAGDTIGGAGVAGTVLFAKGQIATDGVIEGGVKYFTFNWKQPYVEPGATLRLTLNAGDKSYQQDYVVATDNGGTTHEHLYFAGDMQVKKNVQLILKNESFKTDGGAALTENGRIAIDKFEIVPYLFYKTKSHKIDVVKGDAPTWTNTDLINNTEGDGTIVYSVPEGNGVATIDPESGEVTAEGNGITTVTATWTPADAEDGEVVTTTYTLEVFAERLDAELTFDPEEITVGVNEPTITTPTLNNPHELTVKYSSSDETKATVDENSGAVTLKGVAGDVIISAKSEETDTYQEGNASYTIHVLLLTSEVTFPNLTDNKKTVNMDADPFTENISVKVNGEEVPEPTITYESSNKNAARVNETTGEVTIISVGTTVITATVAPTETYAGTTASYTLKVEKGNVGDAWVEGFEAIEVKESYVKQEDKVTGDKGVYNWKVAYYQRNTADVIGSDKALRMRGSDAPNNHIMFDGEQEGGIKALAFDWKLAGSATDLTTYFDVTVDGVKNSFEYSELTGGVVQSYAQAFNVRKNTTLAIEVPTGGQATIFGPISITPYLLYTTKVVEKTYNLDGTNTVDASANLINNLEEDETVTYSLSEGAQASIDGSTITLANATEDVTVTATWGEVSTTFTLKVTKAEDPVVEPDFVLENKTAGAYATICLPNKIDRVENATLYSINYGNTQEIEFVEADFENDKAGMPYLVQVENDGNVNFFYTEDEPVDAPVSAEEAKGFVGSLQKEDQLVPSDGSSILVSGGQLHIAGEWCYLSKNHAYIDANKLPTVAAPLSGAPRRTVRLYNPDAAPTNLNGINGTVKPMKVLRDGQFYIIRDTKTYNAQGIEVQ